jgi:hypothetical protein
VTQLVLKRASASRPSGQWSDKDYDVLANGKVVGRIYEPRGSRFGPPELRWGWSIITIVPGTPGVTNGTAATRERRWRSFVRLGRRQRLVVPLRSAFTAAVAFGPSLHKE